MIVLKKLGLYICRQCYNRTFVYKSVYNIENLYPASKDLFLTYSSQHLSDSTGTSDKFDGCIPLKKLTVKYSKSSGKGGQHANKTMTKAQVRFRVSSADWLPSHTRSAIIEKFRTRINKAGELIVWSDDSRYQLNNMKNCLVQIRDIITEAEKPTDTSKEERIALLNNMESIQAAHQKRLRKKRMQGYTKSMRNTYD